MKPSEMSNEELVAMVGDWASSHMTATDDYVMDEFDEIAARLRNSIPKPVVRTTPPTVDEVADSQDCLAYDGISWDSFDGYGVRTHWHDQPSGDITHWMPAPPKPLGLEGGE